MRTRAFRTVFACGAGLVVLGATFAACVEPPPKIAAIPPGGLSLRLFVFGASAQEGRQAFEAAKQTNKTFALVREGGDGELLVGLENDSPKCVQPTALCSFKVAIRVRDNAGKVVHASTTTAAANAERCADLCDRALNAAVVRAIEAAAPALKGHAVDGDAEAPDADDSSAEGEGGAAQSAAVTPPAASAQPAPKKTAGKAAAAKAEPVAKPEPLICEVAHGPHLPAEEAEKRAAQVEALKRIGVLDEEEYDCLRKAYLDRL